MLPICVPHVRACKELLQIIAQYDEVRVHHIVEKVGNWNPIVHVKAKADRTVVDEHHVLEGVTRENLEWLDVELVPLDAVRAVQAFLEKFPLGIDHMLDDLLCIVLLACSEQHDVVKLRKIVEGAMEVWPRDHLVLTFFYNKSVGCV